MCVQLQKSHLAGELAAPVRQRLHERVSDGAPDEIAERGAAPKQRRERRGRHIGESEQLQPHREVAHGRPRHASHHALC